MKLSTDRITLQMRVVSLLYGAAYLEGRRRAGLRLTADDNKRLAELTKLFEGDAKAGQRQYRRVSSSQPALVKVGSRYVPALILNMSAGGFLVACSDKVAEGGRIQVKVGSAELVEYHFPCEVRHVARPHGVHYLGVSFSSIPLEVRHGGGEAEVTALPLGAVLARA